MRDFENNIHLTLDDQFMVSSITKKITAMTVVQSDTDLHAPLSTKKCEKSQNISLHELLTHTSGISDDPKLYPAIKGEHCYANKGYTFAAEVIEELTGKTFDDLLTKTLACAGMKDSILQPQKTSMTYAQLLKIAPRLAKPYNKDKNPEYIQEPRNYMKNPSAGLISTAKDLILWDKAVYEKKIWGESKSNALTLPYVEFDHYRWGKISYGYGTQIVKEKPLEYSHSGMGKSGISTILYYPETKTHVIILENISWKDEKGLADFKRHDAIRSIVREELSK
jgi:CubicO group peptidase (beta-lactamase class C family)